MIGEKISIQRMLESEGNKETADDKFNRVDVLAENSKGDLIIIEIQNNAEAIYDVVRNMKSQGLPVELIAKTTGLSREDIDKL